MIRKIVLAAFFSVLLMTSIRQAKASVDVDVNLFYGQLAPYGNWETVPSFGVVWHPTEVAVGWRPYSVGHWVWTDAGWTWVSYEPWGWAAYHYGRWYYDPGYGWLWVPGSVWGPAWVSWYYGPEYVGWVPLAPVASLEISPRFCVFVSFGSFLSGNIERVAIDRDRNITIIHHVEHFNNIRIANRRVFNGGPGLARVERMTGRKVTRVSLVERNLNQRQIRHLGSRVNDLRGRSLYVYRPSVRAVKGRETPLVRSEAERGTVSAENKRFVYRHSAHVSPVERRSTVRQSAGSALRHNVRSTPYRSFSRQPANFVQRVPQAPVMRSAPRQGGNPHPAPQARSAPGPRQQGHPGDDKHRQDR